MDVFYGFDSLKRFRSPVVTVGSYDGVHAGHRKILGDVISLARDMGGESVVVTFSPHPRRVLEADSSLRLLNSLCEKELLLERVGIDNLVVAPFTREFSRISSYDFVRDYLIGKIGVHTLTVGFNHHFGCNREGDFDYLDRLRKEFGFGIYMIPQQEVDDEKVSSTVIRSLISDGRMYKASQFLRYPYFMLAQQIEYEGGMVVIPDEPLKLLPPPGGYSVSVEDGGEGGKADTLNIGADNRLSLDGVYGTDGLLKITFH